MKPTFLFLLCAVAATGCSSLSREQISEYNAPQVPPPVYAKIRTHQRLALSDVVDLSKNGVRSSQIITYLAYSGTEFDLTSQDVENLRHEGVNGDVITYIREKPNQTGGLLSTFED